jgi:riboflavin kinase/FMN adenylyltransferase
MQIHHQLENLPAFRNAVLTIGTFDGVHSGHMQIISQMKQAAAIVDGETVIITFHPHPRKIVPGKSGDVFLLTTMEERAALLHAAGIDHLVIITFTDDFAQQEAAAYIQDFLLKYFHPHTIIIGYDHRFGKNRSGDYHLLEAFASQHGYRVKEISEKVLDEITVSSTRIRTALLKGDISLANALLGYPYFFSGRVVHGNKRGRNIGFPTANLDPSDAEKLIPGDGVYAVTARLKPEGTAGNPYKGMMNIGFRPTVDGSRRVIEVNLFDFDRDIYEQEMMVFVHRYIRGEQKFSGLDELKERLNQDREIARQSFNF